MRRRRSPRVVWLPNDPFFSIDSATLAHSSIMRAADQIGGSVGDQFTIVAPVVRDSTPNPLTGTTTLSDLYGSGYRLRRIVGKFWCDFTARPDEDVPGIPDEAVVTVGLIVLRTDDQGLALNAATPEVYSPAIIENIESPWIWRRSWLLSKQITQDFINRRPGGVESLAAQVRHTNSLLGGNSDGAHIDQKTARIVSTNERLFLVITATNMSGGGEQLITGINYTWELRVLGSLRTNVGNRRNASR